MYTHYNQEGKYGQANINGMLPSAKIRRDHYMTLYGKRSKGRGGNSRRDGAWTMLIT
jgi:hypothetical protein